MIRRGHIVALVLVLVCNVAVLIQVAADRRDPPHADVWLTERELPLLAPEKESSLLVMQLALGGRGDGDEAAFDDALLRRLGIDCSVPADSEKAGLFYNSQLPRPAWVALEYEGEAWKAWQRRERDTFDRRVDGPAGPAETREAFESRLENSSRLFLVAGSADRAELRGRYPDSERVLILPVHVGPWLKQGEGVKPRLAAVILWEPGREVMVPRSLRGPLADLEDRPFDRDGKPKSYLPPRYRAHLLIGRRDLPRLAAVEPLPAPAGPAAAMPAVAAAARSGATAERVSGIRPSRPRVTGCDML